MDVKRVAVQVPEVIVKIPKVIAKVPKIWRRSSAGLILLLAVTFTLTPGPAEDWRNNLQYTRRAAILNTPCVSEELTAIAQNHAQYMANTSHLFHELLGVLWKLPLGWWAAGEIVGRGQDMASIHDAFLHSPTHAGVIYDKRWTHMGIGTARGVDGRMYLSVLFVARRDWCGVW